MVRWPIGGVVHASRARAEHAPHRGRHVLRLLLSAVAACLPSCGAREEVARPGELALARFERGERTRDETMRAVRELPIDQRTALLPSSAQDARLRPEAALIVAESLSDADGSPAMRRTLVLLCDAPDPSVRARAKDLLVTRDWVGPLVRWALALGPVDTAEAPVAARSRADWDRIEATYREHGGVTGFGTFVRPDGTLLVGDAARAFGATRANLPEEVTSVIRDRDPSLNRLQVIVHDEEINRDGRPPNLRSAMEAVRAKLSERIPGTLQTLLQEGYTVLPEFKETASGEGRTTASFHCYVDFPAVRRERGERTLAIRCVRCGVLVRIVPMVNRLDVHPIRKAFDGLPQIRDFRNVLDARGRAFLADLTLLEDSGWNLKFVRDP